MKLHFVSSWPAAFVVNYSLAKILDDKRWLSIGLTGAYANQASIQLPPASHSPVQIHVYVY